MNAAAIIALIEQLLALAIQIVPQIEASIAAEKAVIADSSDGEALARVELLHQQSLALTAKIDALRDK